jgi:hypothetical protein
MISLWKIRGAPLSSYLESTPVLHWDLIPPTSNVGRVKNPPKNLSSNTMNFIKIDNEMKIPSLSLAETVQADITSIYGRK